MKSTQGLLLVVFAIAMAATVSFGSNGPPTTKESSKIVMCDDLNFTYHAMDVVASVEIANSNGVEMHIAFCKEAKFDESALFAGDMAFTDAGTDNDSPTALFATIKQTDDNREVDLPSYHAGKFRTCESVYKTSKSPPIS